MGARTPRAKFLIRCRPVHAAGSECDGDCAAGLGVERNKEICTMDIVKVVTAMRQYTCIKMHRGASQDQIAHVSRALSVRFPKSYKYLLSECGWIDMNGQILYGLGPDAKDRHSVLVNSDIESVRADPPMLHRLIPLMNDGFGNHYCLDTKYIVDGECPIVFWDHEHPRGELQVPKKVSVNLAAWLSRRLRDLPQD
jgi:hypothetical protein